MKLLKLSSTPTAQSRRARGNPIARGRTALMLAGLSALAVAGLAGCGKSQSQSAPAQNSNLKPLSVLYGQYLGSHRGQPPESEKQFKEFIQQLGPQQLANLNVKEVDQIFISSRDHEPYAVVYGKPQKPTAGGAPSVIAFERTGVEGKRFVANSLGAIEELDESRFKQRVATSP